MVPLGCVAVSQGGVVAALLMAFLPLRAGVAGIEFSRLVFGVAVFMLLNPSPLRAVEVGIGVFLFTGCVPTRLMSFVRVVARRLVVIPWVEGSVFCAVLAAALEEIPSVGGVVMVLPLVAVGLPGGSLVVCVGGGIILCLPLRVGLFAVVAKMVIFFSLTC